MKCSENIKNLREKMNLTQEQLAFHLKVTPEEVALWENGGAIPSDEKLVELSRLFGVSRLSILGEDEENSGESYTRKQNTFYENVADKIKKEFTKENFSMKSENALYNLLHFPLWLVTVVAFLLLGFLSDMWHPGWLVFFFPPFVYGIISAVLVYKRTRNPVKLLNALPIPILALAIFLALGFFLNLWHPGWLVFIAIPLYYLSINYVKDVKRYLDSKKGRDSSDDDFKF